MQAWEAQPGGKRRTEGIEGPQAIRETLLLSESALVQAMVCETVHMELSCSSVHQRMRKCIDLRLVLGSIARECGVGEDDSYSSLRDGLPKVGLGLLLALFRSLRASSVPRILASLLRYSFFLSCSFFCPRILVFRIVGINSNLCVYNYNLLYNYRHVHVCFGPEINESVVNQ